MKVKKLFNEAKEKYGSVVWYGVELALTQNPYPDSSFGDWWFTTTAMDKDGNLWDVFWSVYADQVEDWDTPSLAEMVDKGYYLDK